MKNKKGLSLIEVILVMALIGILISVIFSPFIFSLKQFKSQSEQARIISTARRTMDHLTREIRETESVDSYRLVDKVLYKDNIKITEGIDEINIETKGLKVEIEITIGEYSLSSDINLRKREGELN